MYLHALNKVFMLTGKIYLVFFMNHKNILYSIFMSIEAVNCIDDETSSIMRGAHVLVFVAM